ncbi:MAG: DUF3179 domain-containing protein [Granulosicoccaceae bacterium]
MRKLLTVLLWVYLGSAAAQSYPHFPNGEFPKTESTITSVNFSEILSGGPPRDGIPPIDAPEFVVYEDADEWLDDQEPVILFEHNGTAKIYPLQILMFHEIVNDTVAGLPVAVTFCPLCNASIVYERTIDDTVLDFGTTGRLRNSDLIMYDRQSESWWQQFTGVGIIGQYTDISLTELPSQIVAYGVVKAEYDNAGVLSRDTGFKRPYGKNPYRGYDNIDSSPFLFRDATDPRLPPMERVLGIPVDGGNVVVPFTLLQTQTVIYLNNTKTPIVIIANTQVKSALDNEEIAESRDIPSAAAFVAQLGGELVELEMVEGVIKDKQTGSVWNSFGQATSGELKGQRLKQMDKGVHFAFAWLAFDPEAVVYKPQ